MVGCPSCKAPSAAAADGRGYCACQRVCSREPADGVSRGVTEISAKHLKSFGGRARTDWHHPERTAWYVYDWASQVYSAMAITFFMPLLMLSMAQMAALDKPVVTCAGANVTCSARSCLLPNQSVAPMPCKHCMLGDGNKYWNPETQQLDSPPSGRGLYFFGEVGPFNFTTRVLSFSVLLQTVIFISLGAIADFGKWRYRLLLASTVMGTLSTMSILFVTDHSQYQTLGALVMISNAMYGVAMVFYNAYLPVLVDSHEDVVESGNNFLVRDEVLNFISSAGSLMGYASSVIMAIIVLTLLFVTKGSVDDKYRLCIFCAGLWWALWSIWSFCRLQTHEEVSRKLHANEWIIFAGWASFFNKLSEIRRYPQTFKFLVAWFVYSDTYSTIAGVGILVLQDRLCMGGFQIALLLLEVLSCAALGNYLTFRAQRKWQLTTKFMICLLLGVYLLIAVMMMIGISDAPIGLKNTFEAYIFACVHGCAIGSIQAYSRSLMADLTVHGKETEWFALFEITDKGSSWMGPLIVGEIYSATKNFNIAFIPLFVSCLLSFPLVLWVDREQGMIDSGRSQKPEGGVDTLSAQELELVTIPPAAAGEEYAVLVTAQRN